MDNLNWQSVVVIVIVCGLVSGLIGYSIAPSEIIGLTEQEVDNKVSEAVNQSVLQKNIQIEMLENQIAELENKTPEYDDNGDIEIEFLGYLIDELYLNKPLEDTYSDREVKTLFDGKVDFDGEDYDAEETLIVKDIELLANENDFEGDVYMVIPKGAIEYKLEFESDLNTSLIDEEETLEFSFLGKEVEISNWDDNEITIFKGTKMFVDKGEIVNFEDYKIVLISVTEESVYISVEDSKGDLETRIIDEDKTKNVNGLKIKVGDVFPSVSDSFAQLIVGEDIKTEVINGNEYEENSVWEWKISSNSIGIVLNEDFTEIDKEGDEEFPAVAIDEKFCLPNDYICLLFNGMVEEDIEEYNLELDEKSGVDYVRIDGKFLSGIKDFNRIYLNTSNSKIYDRDWEEITETIELGNTKSILNISSGKIVIEDFEVNFWLNETNVKDDDVDFLTEYGVIVINPEDSADDFEWTIEVPESRIEGSISLI